VDMKGKSEGTKDIQIQVGTLIARTPLSAICLELVCDEQQEITDYHVIDLNERSERVLKISKQETIGKRASEAFGRIDGDFAANLTLLGNKAYENSEKSVEARIFIYDHIYKITLFFISDTFLMGVFVDIQSQLFRKHYQRGIPHDVIARSIAENWVALNCNDKHASDDHLLPAHESAIQIIPQSLNFCEPGDIVFRDSLTGLYDRLFALEAMRMYINRGTTPFSIVMGDINGLSTINDTMGYDTGDEILAKVARILKTSCRDDDIVARWGGDSFMLLLPNTSPKETQIVLTRLYGELDRRFGENSSIMTFGYAAMDDHPRTAEELIREAERWTYRKKLLINKSHRSSIIQLLLTMLHEKSSDTQEHTERLENHCRRIAGALELSDEMVNDLVLLSMLHDIGKVGTPESILNKPGPLTPEERARIEQHPEIGYRITQAIPELSHASKYIMAHHEWWDGTGYPNGLSGAEIPLASRIIAVVDAYDVIVTGRSYRAARSKEDAIRELKRCAGTQFDPKIVDIYVKLLESMGDDRMES